MTDRNDMTSSEQSAAQRRRLETCLARRNRTEFVAGGAASVFLLAAGVTGLVRAGTMTGAVAAVGLLLVAGGLVAVLWRLRRHVAAQSGVVAGESPTAMLAGRLRRERDLLRSVWAWYIGPLVPGLVLVWGALFAGGAFGTALAGTAISVIAAVWIARANHRAAAAYDDQIRQLGLASG